MNEYEIVLEHIQQVATIAKKFGIADKPEVLEYLTLVQLQAAKRDRARVIDNKIQEVEGEIERLDGELEIMDEAKNIKLEKAPKETLGADLNSEEHTKTQFFTSRDEKELDSMFKKGVGLMAFFEEADPKKGDGARSRIKAVVKIDKLMSKIKDKYYTEKVPNDKAVEVYGRLSGFKLKMLS